MVIRHCGYTAVVKVSDEVNWEGKPIPQDIDIEEQPEGGANALNVNRFVYQADNLFAMFPLTYLSILSFVFFVMFPDRHV